MDVLLLGIKQTDKSIDSGHSDMQIHNVTSSVIFWFMPNMCQIIRFSIHISRTPFIFSFPVKILLKEHPAPGVYINLYSNMKHTHLQNCT